MEYRSMPKWRRQLRYRAYLETEHWKEKRKRIIWKAGGRCLRCGAHATAVHYERYRGFDQERDTDLTAVCSRCHTKLHPA